MYRILKQEGRAKRAVFDTVHGTVQTPLFMNVGTAGRSREQWHLPIWNRSEPRWNFPILIIFM